MLKEAKLLNRAITWSKEGICWEPDLRHVELTLRDMGLDDEKAGMVVTPGVKPTVDRKVKAQDDK